MTKPAVLFGGPSPEHDISILTGLQAARALANAGREVDCIYWSKSGHWHLVDADLEASDFADGVPGRSRALHFEAEPGGGFFLKKKPLDVSVVLNCCHGGPGEDGTLQAVFELSGVRFTGPDSAGSALGMDKLAFGSVMEAARLPSLPRVLVGSGSPDFGGPYIVKPRYGGSSIGIEVVDDFETAQALCATSPHLKRGAVLEPFLSGSADLNIAVRTYPTLQTSAIEAPLRADEAIYDYSQKYLVGEGGMDSAKRELPARISPEMTRRVEDMARQVAILVGIRTISRIDFLLNGESLYVNEINTIPGSLSGYLWIDPPLSRAQLLSDALEEVEVAPVRQYSTVGSDGSALRNAGTIASKLG